MKKKIYYLVVTIAITIAMAFSSVPVKAAEEFDRNYARLELEILYPAFNFDGYYTKDSFESYEAAREYANFVMQVHRENEEIMEGAVDLVKEAREALEPAVQDAERDLNIRKLIFNIQRMSTLKKEDYTEYDWEYINIAIERAVETLFSQNVHSRALEMDTLMVKMLGNNLNKVTDMDITNLYTDVKADAWYKGGVMFTRANGIMNGNNGKFNPTESITRAQIVTTLYRLAGEPKITDKTAVADFTDVAEGKYYTDAVCWAYTYGIATGNNGKFDPNGRLTRQQFAALLYRFTEHMRLDTEIEWHVYNMLNVDKVSEYAQAPVQWAIEKGYIGGSKVTDAKGNVVYDLNPTGNTTRAQVATILMRFCVEN